MSTKQLFHVAGVDGCKAGWFVAIASATRENETDTFCEFNLKNVFIASTFTEVLSKTSDCKLVCVDIPIGLSDGDKPRECDGAARELLRGRRASSVFRAPIRRCLTAKDYETACRISFEHSGKKLSMQIFYILDKIRQVDDIMSRRPELQRRIREIHPEILFWALNHKQPMQHKKSSIVGREERIRLLAPVFPNVKEIVAEARKPKEVAPDDILDAIVAAWAAGQAVIGKAKTLPEKPQLDSKGLKMEMLYPACYNQ
jgi:predicted RNase H-like nuclease